MMQHPSTPPGAGLIKRAMHRLVPALFLCIAPLSQAATNWVDGLAYGTNFSVLATAGSIASQASTNGSLIIGHSNTTNLTLSHDIAGFVLVTNATSSFTVAATGATLKSQQGFVFAAANATNLVITGGRFIGIEGSGGNLPPIPGQPQPTNSTVVALGGLLFNSDVTIVGTEFAGVKNTDGLLIEQTTLVVSNGIFRGGATGAGLIARDNSSVTIYDGSFTGGVGNTAFNLQDSDATVYGGTFVGNIGGDSSVVVAGTGLFSQLTKATTNTVSLHGGDFSSLAFFGVDGAVQNFLAGTNLTVQNGIIQDGGIVNVDNQNNTALRNMWIQSGTMNFGSQAFSLIDGGNLAFSIADGTNGFLTADTVYLHTNATLFVDASASGFTAGTTNVTLLSTTSGLFMIGTSTNAAIDADFTTNNVTATAAGRNKLNDVFVDNGRSLRFEFTTASLADYWNATGQMVSLADELDLINKTTMMATIDSINNSALSYALVESTYFTTLNTFQTALHGLQAALGQTTARSAEVREQRKLVPPGAKGPKQKNDVRGWAKYYGQFYNHDAEGLNRQYDTTLQGGAIGVDKSIGNLLLGLSGGAGSYRTTDEIDSEENTRAYHGALYGTYSTQRAYIDAGMAYGYNQVKTQTGGPFPLAGTFDAQIISTYLGAGYDLIDTEGGTVFTPEASIQYARYNQEAYSETSDRAVPRNIEAFDADSLRSSIGLNVSMLNTSTFETFGVKLDGRAHWLHEFNPEPGRVGFSLAGGDNSRYQLALPFLDEEVFRAGFGFTFFNTRRNKPQNVLLRLDFDELFGDGFNSHNLSAKVIYAF